MEDLIRIGTMCQQLGTTTRSVRYYEEMDLLTSSRPHENNYRYYDVENYNKLRIILFLRTLDISIKDIKIILKNSDIKKLFEVLESRTREIDQDIDTLNTLKQYILTLIDTLKNKSLDDLAKDIPGKDNEAVRKTFFKEAFNMVKQQIQALNDNDVKIVKLPDMKVAYTHSGITTNPEGKAVDSMMDNVRKYKLYTRDDLRFFGFDNPSPKTLNFDEEEYGYEMWMKLPKDVSLETGMKTKNVEGGLYATITFAFSSGTDMIPKRWQQLVEWVKKSDYEYRKAQCFEEYICHFDDEGKDSYNHLEFYLPIK